MFNSLKTSANLGAMLTIHHKTNFRIVTFIRYNSIIKKESIAMEKTELPGRHCIEKCYIPLLQKEKIVTYILFLVKK